MKHLLAFLALVFTLAVYAASSETTHYNLLKPADGDSNWGDGYRANMDSIDTQMFVNQTTISDHIADAVGAHTATAISTSSGSLVCLTQITVQAYLDCLDAQVGAITGGTVVTTNTAQTITGEKTFSTTPIFSSLSTGLLHSDVSGNLTSSLLVNADVDEAAAIAYSKLNLGDSILNADINSAAAIAYSKLNLSDSILNADINSAAAIADTKLATIATAGKVSNSATTATDANTASAIVARDASGNFIAGTITAALSGNASTATALAANPTDCSSTTFAQTIAANGDLTCAAVNLAADVDTSVLPLANGGTNKALTASAGSVVYSDADSLELLPDGNANQVLGTDGAGTLSWVDATSGYSQQSDTTLTASDFIAIGTGNADRLQHWRVQSNGGPVTLSTTPFGTTNPQDRTIVCLVGLSDADTVTISVTDAADGVVGQGDVTLGQYDSACFRYLSTEDRYVIESRSN